MSDLIDKESLYNQFAYLEAMAFEQLEKHRHDVDSAEWFKWCVILHERTAYTHDVFDAPTVDAEPVKYGHWKETPYTDYDDTWECSVCGAAWTFIEGTPTDNGANYCPHCGARMDGREDDD